MRKLIDRLFRSQRGFTLLEMTVVVTILALLTTIVAASVTGTSGEARTSGKDGDMKNTDTAVARFESVNPGTFPVSESSNPGTAIVGGDTNGDGIIIIFIDDTGISDGSLKPAGTEVTCAGAGRDASIDACFGSIDFAALLVPDFIKSAPQHGTFTAPDSIDITEGGNNTVDLTITGCTPAGETCEIHVDFAIDGSADDFFVWNVDKNNNVIVLKNDADYGK